LTWRRENRGQSMLVGALEQSMAPDVLSSALALLAHTRCSTSRLAGSSALPLPMVARDAVCDDSAPMRAQSDRPGRIAPPRAPWGPCQRRVLVCIRGVLLILICIPIRILIRISSDQRSAAAGRVAQPMLAL